MTSQNDKRVEVLACNDVGVGPPPRRSPGEDAVAALVPTATVSTKYQPVSGNIGATPIRLSVLMKRTLKKVAARLPRRWQQELKRRYFGRQIRNHTFRTDEPEFELLPAMVSPGAWVLDIGANVGHYTVRLSELVGERGRVISFEPVPETFELLAANVALIPQKNVTLINAAASDSGGISGMEIPKFEDTGLDNFYTAHLSGEPSELNVLCIAVDSFTPPQPIRLVKIDAEGHELPALRGMKRLLERDHPILIVEDNSSEVSDYLIKFGYSSEKLDGSSNRIFRAGGQNARRA